MTLRLFHRTCSHRIDEILASGTLLPAKQPLLGVKLVWLTHIPWATREALALSSDTLRCDRMEHLLEVTQPQSVVAWNVARTALPMSAVRVLEAARGSRPEYWWVSGEPQLAALVKEAVS